MRSPWRRLDAIVGRAVNRQWGEEIALQPAIPGEYTEWQPDPQRTETTVRGIFSSEFSSEDLRGERLKGEFAGVGRIAVGESCVLLMAEVYASLGYQLRAGDRLVLIERSGKPSYVVSANHPLDEGDALLVLTRG